VGKDLWNVFEEKPLKDVAEMYAVTRRVTNSDASRIEKIKELLAKHNRLIVFYNFNYELEILRSLNSNYTVAEWNGHKHQPIPNTESWVYLVQYAAGAEGWNCIETDAMAFYSETYSYRMFEQAQGRIDRLNTTYVNLFYYMLTSGCWLDRAIRSSRLNKEDFNRINGPMGGFDSGDWQYA
jgi:superfamily II DNA or RNA helicase